jgi:hypothetical protein
MDVVFTHGAGLDVHKQTVMACRVTPDPTGQQADGIMEGKAFGTLTRDRTKLVQERSREVKRGQGVLERAHIKLASVATDIMGVSGQALLAALIAGRAEPKSIHMTLVHSSYRRPKLEWPFIEPQCANLVWTDLGRWRRWPKAGCGRSSRCWSRR